MQVGTEILLARMKEYPDEFFTGGYESRWTAIIDDARKYLPKEDVEALDEGYRLMQVDRFNERVLARLAGEDKQEAEETLKYKVSGRYTTGLSDPRALAQTQQEYEWAVKQQQYAVEQQQRAMNAAQQNQYASGFGSSFNDWLTGGHK
jgi:selenocysteine-specific translation elongation factor